MATKWEKREKYRAEQKRLGLCIECNEKAEPGRVRCQNHLDKRNTLNKNWVKRHKAEGLCTHCCEKATDGFQCAAHGEENRKRQAGRGYWKNADGTTKDRIKKTVVAYMKANIAKGLCRHCPTPLSPNSKGLCEYHLAKSRQYSGSRASDVVKRERRQAMLDRYAVYAEYSKANPTLKAYDLAKHFNVDKITIHKALKWHGVNSHAILAKRREEIAAYLIANPKVTQAQAAELFNVNERTISKAHTESKVKRARARQPQFPLSARTPGTQAYKMARLKVTMDKVVRLVTGDPMALQYVHKRLTEPRVIKIKAEIEAHGYPAPKGTPSDPLGIAQNIVPFCLEVNHETP